MFENTLFFTDLLLTIKQIPENRPFKIPFQMKYNNWIYVKTHFPGKTMNPGYTKLESTEKEPEQGLCTKTGLS